MDGLKQQLERVKKQREKIKSNISGLYGKIRDIRIKKVELQRQINILKAI